MYAQLYDSEDEVRIYVNDEALISGAYPQYAVFNFNGDKGALLEMSVGEYCCAEYPATCRRGRDKFIDDDHYFEKLIFGKEIVLVSFETEDKRKLTSNGYTYNLFLPDHTVRLYQPGMIIPPAPRWMFEFSYDGKHMRLGNRINKVSKSFTRVSKQKLDELIIAYNKKSTKKWR